MCSFGIQENKMNQRAASRFFIYIMMSLVLTACGGGGGGGGPLVGGGTVDPATPTITLTLFDENGNIIAEVNGNTVAVIQALVKNADGRAVSGIKVTFSSTKGVFDPEDGTALTDASGIATIKLTGGTSAGVGTITASATVEGESAEAGSVNFETDGKFVDEEVSLFDLALVLSNKSINLTNPGTATVTVTDNAGDPAVNQVIKFTATRGNLSPNDGAVLTDANGVAVVTLSSDGTSGAGILAASLISGDLTFNSTNISFILVNSATLTLDLKDQQTGESVTNIKANQVVDVIAKLSDGDGMPVVGQPIDFTSGNGTLSVSSTLTLEDGTATVQLTAGNEAGADKVTAETTIGANVINNTVYFETDGPQGANIQLLLEPSTLTSNSPGTATITVTDSDDEIIEGAIVEFSTTLGVLDPSSGSVNTDDAGRAQVLLSAANNETGKGTLSAIVTIDGQQFSAVPVDFIIANLVMGMTLSDTTISGNELFMATANLTDVDGSPLANIAVDFTTTIGVFDSSTSNSAVTDGFGNAQVALRGGATVGEGEVTAKSTVNGVSVESKATFQNTSNQPTIAVSLSADEIAQGSTATVTARVLDFDGITPMPGQLVTFGLGENPLGTLDRTTAITGPTGDASVALTAGPGVGVGLVTASTIINEDIELSDSELYKNGVAAVLPLIEISLRSPVEPLWMVITARSPMRQVLQLYCCVVMVWRVKVLLLQKPSPAE
jgi:hypothetical protein